jgi:hypothetical protein
VRAVFLALCPWWELAWKVASLRVTPTIHTALCVVLPH